MEKPEILPSLAPKPHSHTGGVSSFEPIPMATHTGSRSRRARTALVTHSMPSAKSPEVPPLRDSPLGFHEIATRCGTLAFPERRRRVHRQKLAPTPTGELDDSSSLGKHSITLSALVDRRPSDVANVVAVRPIFMKTLMAGDPINPAVFAPVLGSFTPAQLKVFMKHLSLELSLFASIPACKSLEQIENTIMSNIPVKSATIWVQGEDSDFLASPTLKELVPTNRSILGWSLQKRKSLVTDDPSNFEGFDIDFDLPRLRGSISMVLLPVFSGVGDPIAVIEFVDMTDTQEDAATSFSEYDVRVLKAIRKLLKLHFFGPMERRVDLHKMEIVSVMSDLNRLSSSAVAADWICQFLKKVIGCEGADIFRFDARTRKIRNLKDGIEYSDLSGGASYVAALRNRPVFMGHGMAKNIGAPELDRRFANRSILSKMFTVEHRSYVFTLRAKWLLPSFLPEDLLCLTELSVVLGQCLILADSIEAQTTDYQTNVRFNNIKTATYDALDQYVDMPHKKWEIVRAAATKYFGCEAIFVAVYHNMEMRFMPTEVNWKFDDCIAGNAYNYREDVFYEMKDDKPVPLYQALKVECRQSAAFPFSVDGKVKGAIELVNLNRELFDSQAKVCIATLVTLLLMKE
jgi:hypothetical protein